MGINFRRKISRLAIQDVIIERMKIVMKIVEEKHIEHIHIMAGEGIPDVTGYEYLEGRSNQSEYEFFVNHYAATSDFKFIPDENQDEYYDIASDFGYKMQDEGEYEKFLAAFFNSAEDLNDCFWSSYDEVFKSWKEWETKDREDRKKRFPNEKYQSDFPGLLFENQEGQ